MPGVSLERAHFASSGARGPPQFLKKRSENHDSMQGQMKVFHVGSDLSAAISAAHLLTQRRGVTGVSYYSAFTERRCA